VELRLEAYDNIAASADRLLQPDQALDALAKKRALLDELVASGGWHREHEYRYHANRGTVLVHRWLRVGAPRETAEDFADLVQAREHIARAIAINPDAHFWREIVQIEVMNWLLWVCRRSPEESGGSFGERELAEYLVPRQIPHGVRLNRAPSQLSHEKAVEGLLGLMVLGNAWESVDVSFALAMLLSDVRNQPTENINASLGGLALRRAKQLVDQKGGPRSIRAVIRSCRGCSGPTHRTPTSI
jgi:hypothetical protein